MEPLARSADPETVVDKLLELYRQAGNQEYHGNLFAPPSLPLSNPSMRKLVT